MKEKVNLNPIRMIRISKDLTKSELAEYFKVSSTFMGLVENGKRKFKIQVLKFGLDNLGISLEDYHTLEEFSEFLSNQDLSDNTKYRFMLMKTIGVINPDLKAESDAFLDKKILQKKL